MQTLLFGGGVLGGILLALMSRVGVAIGAALKARRASRVLTQAVADVVKAEVVEPAAAELRRLAMAREAVAKASRG